MKRKVKWLSVPRWLRSEMVALGCLMVGLGQFVLPGGAEEVIEVSRCYEFQPNDKHPGRRFDVSSSLAGVMGSRVWFKVNYPQRMPRVLCEVVSVDATTFAERLWTQNFPVVENKSLSFGTSYTMGDIGSGAIGLAFNEERLVMISGLEEIAVIGLKNGELRRIPVPLGKPGSTTMTIDKDLIYVADGEVILRINLADGSISVLYSRKRVIPQNSLEKEGWLKDSSFIGNIRRLVADSNQLNLIVDMGYPLGGKVKYYSVAHDGTEWEDHGFIFPHAFQPLRGWISYQQQIIETKPDGSAVPWFFVNDTPSFPKVEKRSKWPMDDEVWAEPGQIKSYVADGQDLYLLRSVPGSHAADGREGECLLYCYQDEWESPVSIRLRLKTRGSDHLTIRDGLAFDQGRFHAQNIGPVELAIVAERLIMFQGLGFWAVPMEEIRSAVKRSRDGIDSRPRKAAYYHQGLGNALRGFDRNGDGELTGDERRDAERILFRGVQDESEVLDFQAILNRDVLVMVLTTLAMGFGVIYFLRRKS